ncbi:hypothetical protein BS47DRAFT_179712 [Hydnum rufescens UP504]|uniref:Uncharacterized protein n=1 Tax=Hydnum rufescens UP504 TaxID=1448309 RepID=A0A9P6DS66_9AGAM|nr:hypothetical protein BS47DRAFT_179712 [Hydnum rufescens UP504]
MVRTDVHLVLGFSDLARNVSSSSLCDVICVSTLPASLNNSIDLSPEVSLISNCVNEVGHWVIAPTSSGVGSSSLRFADQKSPCLQHWYTYRENRDSSPNLGNHEYARIQCVPAQRVISQVSWNRVPVLSARVFGKLFIGLERRGSRSEREPEVQSA